jgi:hypothetical protein
LVALRQGQALRNAIQNGATHSEKWGSIGHAGMHAIHQQTLASVLLLVNFMTPAAHTLRQDVC